MHVELYKKSPTSIVGDFIIKNDKLKQKNIYKNKIVKNLGDCKSSVLLFSGDKDLRKLTAEDREKIVRYYYNACYDKSIKEIKSTGVMFDYNYLEKSFYSSKGAEIVQDYQRCHLVAGFDANVNGVTYPIFKQLYDFEFDKLWNRENEILEEETVSEFWVEGIFEGSYLNGEYYIINLIKPVAPEELEEEEYLPKLLESIKSQDFTDYEIIVADAQSDDNTREIAKEYGCIVVEGGLPGPGRNRGAEVAQGEMLLFLDSDFSLLFHVLVD